MNIRTLLKKKTIRNAGWIVGGRIVQMFINLLVGLLMARYLGPANYGLVNYGAAYVSFFSSLASLGVNSVLVKEFLDHPKEEGTIIGTALFMRAISSFLSAITIVGIVAVLDKSEPVTLYVVFLCSLGLIFHIFEVIRYWFQSRLESKVSAMATLLAYIITAAYKMVLMVTGRSVVWFAFSTSLDYICIGIFLMYAYKKAGGGTFKISMVYGKELLAKSCHYILPGVMISINSQMDKMMLKQMVGNIEVGYYSTAVSITQVWCFVLVAIIESLHPSIMTAYKRDEKAFVRKNKQLYAIVFYLSMAAAVFIFVFAEILILIMYGKEYLPVVGPLRILVWYIAFSYLGSARNAWIVCKNCQKYLIHVYASAAASNVILNMILIPQLGAVGAAIASLVAQIMTTMIVPFFIKDLRENSVMMLEAFLLKGIRGN